jgi:uncharacterized small protein (DUF1192 family)
MTFDTMSMHAVNMWGGDYLSVGAGRPPIIGRHRFTNHVRQVPLGNLPVGIPDPFVIPHHMRDTFLDAKVRQVRAGRYAYEHEQALARQDAETRERLAALAAEIEREQAEATQRRREATRDALAAFAADVEQKHKRPPMQLSEHRQYVRNRLAVLYESLAAPEW